MPNLQKFTDGICRPTGTDGKNTTEFLCLFIIRRETLAACGGNKAGKEILESKTRIRRRGGAEIRVYFLESIGLMRTYWQRIKKEWTNHVKIKNIGR